MKKIREKVGERFITKEYELDKKANVLEIIKELLSNSVQVGKIEIYEGVERDMQTINGMDYNVQDFIKEYEYVMRVGNDISFIVNANYNNMDFYLIIDEQTNTISMVSDSKNVELDDIMGQKKIMD